MLQPRRARLGLAHDGRLLCRAAWSDGDPCLVRIGRGRREGRRLDEGDGLCGHCHDLKTRLGWALIEGEGKRPMVPPDDPRHPKNKPK